MNQVIECSTSEIVGAASMTRGGGLLGLLTELSGLHAASQTAVVGIVTKTEGSTYQKQGALVLLDRGGMRHGALSGGCLEPQVEEAAARALREARAHLIEFDTRSDDDLVYGSGTGCRGRTQLLLVPQPPDAPFTAALKALAASTHTLSLDVASGAATGSGVATLQTQRWQWQSSGHAATGSLDDTVEHICLEPPARLLLLGAGPETAPLADFGQRLGWRLRVVEHRGRWLQFARAAGFDDVIEAAPNDAHALWMEYEPDAVLVMTHNFDLDYQHLRYCAASDAAYIGVLGPKQRREALLHALGPERVAKLGQRLHAPIGLDLGGSGPDVLALSIAAEVQQSLNARARVR